MSGFRHILVPVDFSDRCDKVRTFVRELAGRFQSSVTLLHVIQIPSGWYGGVDGGYPLIFDLPSMEAAARKELDEFAAATVTGAERVVRVGDPALEIVKLADERGVDLIMMPTHGYGPFRRLLLGSVTSKVLHDVKCAVWTAAHTDDPDLPAHVAGRSILGAIDLSHASVELLRRYKHLSAELGATLRLVHAVPGTGTETHRGMDAEFSLFLQKAERDEIARLQAEAETNFEVFIEEGSIPQVVHCVALKTRADLVVIGRGRIQESFGQLRSNAYAIVRDSPCPVLTL